MTPEAQDKRYAAAVHSIVHLRGVLGSLLMGEAVDVQGAYDATSWAHIEKVFALAQTDLAAADPHATLGRDAIENWHHLYPWCGEKVALVRGQVRFKPAKP